MINDKEYKWIVEYFGDFPKSPIEVKILVFNLLKTIFSLPSDYERGYRERERERIKKVWERERKRERKEKERERKREK